MREDGPKWIVIFEDASVGMSHFEDEKEARSFFDGVKLNYNCHLYQLVESG